MLIENFLSYMVYVYLYTQSNYNIKIHNAHTIHLKHFPNVKNERTENSSSESLPKASWRKRVL